MRRAGNEPASLQQGRLSRLLRKGWHWGEWQRVSQEKDNYWSSQNRIRYLQMNSAMPSRLIKLFTAVVGKAERDTKTFWLSSAASSRSPGNQPFSLTCSPSQKGNGKVLLCHPPILLSHSQALGSLMIDVQNYFSLCSFVKIHHRADRFPPHRQGFSSCTLLASKKLKALSKAFPSLRGLNRYLSWVVPHLPREMRNYTKTFF